MPLLSGLLQQTSQSSVWNTQRSSDSLRSFLVLQTKSRFPAAPQCVNLSSCLTNSVIMAWPERALSQFQLVPANPQGADFHGPYNKLFNYLFPFDSPFTVVPRYLKPGPSLAFDFTVTFEVCLANRPIFVLVLKTRTDMDYISTRQDADDQMRRRLGDLGGTCPIPTLHAVSAMGTRLCFYSLNTMDVDPEIMPRAIPRHPTRVSDTAPKARWDCDILDATGEARLRAIVDEIHQACAHIAL